MRERKAVLLGVDLAARGALARWATDERRGANAQIELLLCRALGEDQLMPTNARPVREPGHPGSHVSPMPRSNSHR